MIDVIRIPLSKDRLRAMPKEERALFFLLGYAANQITLFSKLVIFSTNKTPTDSVEQRISGAQTQMLARFVIGILFETWRLIHSRFLSTSIGKEFAAKLNPTGQTALAELKKHFRGSHLLNKLRNSVAFHHPYDGDMDAAFEAAARSSDWDSDWNWFHSHAIFNSFYFVSDLVILHAILNAAGETNLIEAQKKIMADVNKVLERMIEFIYALSEAILAKHFGSEITAEVVAKIEDAPSVLDVWLPFYVEFPPGNPSLGAAQDRA
jgi:hypothetical protein